MLTDDEKQQLDEQGFVCLGQLLDTNQLTAVRDRIDQLLQMEGELAGSELLDSKYIRHPKEAAADRLADLVNKGSQFDIFYTHPRILACMRFVLGENIKLSALNYRAARPLGGKQKLHVDWHEAVPVDQWCVCNSIWLLDRFHRDERRDPHCSRQPSTWPTASGAA